MVWFAFNLSLSVCFLSVALLLSVYWTWQHPWGILVWVFVEYVVMWLVLALLATLLVTCHFKHRLNQSIIFTGSFQQFGVKQTVRKLIHILEFTWNIPFSVYWILWNVHICTRAFIQSSLGTQIKSVTTHNGVQCSISQLTSNCRSLELELHIAWYQRDGSSIDPNAVWMKPYSFCYLGINIK